MANISEEPYSGIRFQVDIGTGDTEGPLAAVSEVIFPEARLQALEYRDGNDLEPDVRRLLTTTRYSNLILRRMVRGSLTWVDWWTASRRGDPNAMRTVVVELLDNEGGALALTWKFLRARPVSHGFSPLNALGTEPFIESLEIAFEHMSVE